MKTMRKPHKMSKLKLKTLLASMDKAAVISLVPELQELGQAAPPA